MCGGALQKRAPDQKRRPACPRAVIDVLAPDYPCLLARGCPGPACRGPVSVSRPHSFVATSPQLVSSAKRCASDKRTSQLCCACGLCCHALYRRRRRRCRRCRRVQFQFPIRMEEEEQTRRCTAVQKQIRSRCCRWSQTETKERGWERARPPATLGRSVSQSVSQSLSEAALQPSGCGGCPRKPVVPLVFSS